MDEMVVKIVVELLSTLGLATRELKQGRSSESGYATLLPYSARRSQSHQESFRREGRRGGSGQAGQAHRK